VVSFNFDCPHGPKDIIKDKMALVQNDTLNGIN
jgi:hypothetical protein